MKLFGSLVRCLVLGPTTEVVGRCVHVFGGLSAKEGSCGCLYLAPYIPTPPEKPLQPHQKTARFKGGPICTTLV